MKDWVDHASKQNSIASIVIIVFFLFFDRSRLTLDDYVCVLIRVKLINRLDLQIGAREQKDNAAERQGVNYRSQPVFLLMRDHILLEQSFHGFRLPEEKQVHEEVLEGALEVHGD